MKAPAIPRRGEWTSAALDLLPKDGHLYEVIDGELHLFPPPDEAHDRVVWNLLLQLLPFASQLSFAVKVRPEPLEFSERRYVLPDLILLPNPVFGAGPYELVVEVASPYTRRIDFRAKRELYQHERVWQYWIVDPQRRELFVWRPNADAPEIVRDVFTWHASIRRDALRLDLNAIFSPQDAHAVAVSRRDLFPPAEIVGEGAPMAGAVWTLALLDAIRPDGCRYESVDGRLLISPPQPIVSAQQRALIDLRTVLDESADDTGATVVMGPVNIEFSSTCRLIPDFVAYPVPPAKRTRTQRQTRTAPCLIVDVVSRASNPEYVRAKRELCQRVGVTEYWTVDLEAREVQRWRPESPKPEVVRATLRWVPVPGRRGAVFDLQRFFRLVLDR